MKWDRDNENEIIIEEMSLLVLVAFIKGNKQKKLFLIFNNILYVY